MSTHYDAEGYPLTAGGQRLDNLNVGGKDNHMIQKSILTNYEKIKNLHKELKREMPEESKELKEIRKISVNRERMDRMRNSADPNEPHFGPPRRKRRRTPRRDG